MKEELHVNNRDELSIQACVIQTIQWAESKLVEFHTLAQRKDLQFYDKDPQIQEVLNEAATVLNKTGGLAFKKSIDLMRKHEGKLSIVDCGVREIFGDNSDENVKEKVYSATEHNCNCTRWMQDRFPCRHILYFRKMENLSLLDVAIFAEFYLKETENALQKDLSIVDDSDEKISHQMPEIDDKSLLDSDEDNEDDYVLEPQEKYKIANDMMKELGDLLCHFGTREFRQYMWELELIKRRVRRGHPMIGATSTTVSDGKAKATCSTSEDDLGKM